MASIITDKTFLSSDTLSASDLNDLWYTAKKAYDGAKQYLYNFSYYNSTQGINFQFSFRTSDATLFNLSSPTQEQLTTYLFDFMKKTSYGDKISTSSTGITVGLNFNGISGANMLVSYQYDIPNSRITFEKYNGTSGSTTSTNITITNLSSNQSVSCSMQEFYY